MKNMNDNIKDSIMAEIDVLYNLYLIRINEVKTPDDAKRVESEIKYCEDLIDQKNVGENHVDYLRFDDLINSDLFTFSADSTKGAIVDRDYSVDRLNQKEPVTLDELKQMVKHEETHVSEQEKEKKDSELPFDSSKLSDEELESQINDLYNFLAHQENGLEENSDLEKEYDALVQEENRRKEAKENTEHVPTAEEYHMNPEAYDDYVAEGYIPGTEDFERAAIIDGQPFTPIALSADDKKKEQEHIHEENKGPEENKKNDVDNQGDIPEYVFLQDINSKKYFAKQDVFDRFKISRDESTIIKQNGEDYYEISEDNVRKIYDGQNENPYSRYTVKIRYITLDLEKNENKDEIPRLPGKTIGDEIPRLPGKTIDDVTPELPEPKKEDKNIKVKPSVEGIIAKLTDGLDIKKNTGKKYTYGNLKVSKKFKEELKEDNWIYNVVGFFKKGVQRLIYPIIRHTLGSKSKKMKDVIDTIKGRLDELSDEELEVLANEYKGSLLITDSNNSINSLIEAKISEYLTNKLDKHNEVITSDYKKLFVLLKEIDVLDSQIAKEKDSNKKNILQNKRTQLYQNASSIVLEINDTRIKANNLASSGIHGLHEDFKATSTKMNYQGRRFAKSYDFDNELQARLAKADNGFETARANGDAEGIVKNFVEKEKIYSENTEISNSFFGRRSSGKKYYSPLVKQLDYRDDPFFTDLFTTIAIVSSAISAVNAVRVNLADKQLLQQQQAEAARINAANNQTVDRANDIGKDLQGKADVFAEGQKAKSYQDTLTVADVKERTALDSNNWTFNDSYHTMDPANHQYFNNNFDSVNNQINQTASDYATGSINAQDALKQLTTISQESQKALNETVQEGLDVLKVYAQSHPQFDLHATQEAMEYIVSHPDAILNANQAELQAVQYGTELAGLTAEQVTALSSLPSDMLTTIISAASATVLATRVASTMNQYAYSNKYGDEVTEMMSNYLNDKSNNEEQGRSR